ncbi:hypothetical protein [Mesorhizobium sp.]|uniref:hypothetical protein n=1 Tax=Mesorhizobium sp. TaxID=1871066 RepID=UPI00257F6A33|nr:hypothetical protein [Mesorhizobium sp.]
MCFDPITILSVAGTALSAGGALMQGQQQQQMANMQAKAYEQQAQADQQASAFEQAQERKKQDLLQAQARAQVGASGVAVTGSPTEVMAANAAQNQLDLKAIQYGSQLRQNSLNTQADISRFSGKQAKTASTFEAGGNIFGGLRSIKFGNSAFSPNASAAIIGARGGYVGLY